MKIQTCPICNNHVKTSERYPNYICEECEAKAVNSAGKSVKFFNTSFAGGFVAVTEENEIREKTEDHLCFINNVKCYADEARFGGIVIIPFKK